MDVSLVSVCVCKFKRGLDCVLLARQSRKPGCDIVEGTARLSCACTPSGQSSGRFLRADMSISCDSSAHKMYKALAWVAFCLIPVGFPLGVGVIFWWRERNRMLWVQGKGRHSAVRRCMAWHSTTIDTRWTPFSSWFCVCSNCLQCPRGLRAPCTAIGVAGGTYRTKTPKLTSVSCF